MYGQSIPPPKDLVVFTTQKDLATESREAIQVLIDAINIDRYSAEDFFGSFYTDIGISCGCHAKKGEMCVFLFAKNYSPKHGVKRMDLKVRDMETCAKDGKADVTLEAPPKAVTTRMMASLGTIAISP